MKAIVYHQYGSPDFADREALRRCPENWSRCSSGGEEGADGWSVTLYERGRSHHHVGRWKYCGLSPKGSRTVRSASVLPRRNCRQGTQPEHLSQTPGSEAHRSDSSRPGAGPVVARTSVRPQIRIWKGARGDQNNTPKPYFGICSPIPPRGYAPVPGTTATKGTG